MQAKVEAYGGAGERTAQVAHVVGAAAQRPEMKRGASEKAHATIIKQQQNKTKKEMRRLVSSRRLKNATQITTNQTHRKRRARGDTL
jgi:hypothetical protein